MSGSPSSRGEQGAGPESGPPSASAAADEGGLKSAVRRRSSFRQTLGAVGWSFFGVRKSADQARDVSQLNPIHVIVAGLLAAALFVLALVVLVRWVLASGVAAG